MNQFYSPCGYKIFIKNVNLTQKSNIIEQIIKDLLNIVGLLHNFPYFHFYF